MAILGETKAVSLTLLDGVIGNLNPKTTGIYDLGTSSLKWNNIYGTFKGNADTATEFNTAALITLTGDTTGTASSTKGWSITTTTKQLTATSYTTLNTQEAIDNFLVANKFQFGLFKTNEANNIGMTSNDGMILSLSWNSTTYGAQIALDDNDLGIMKFRGKSTNWGDWRTVLHDGNYTSYTVKKDGTGASGTWGIDITGTAATATNLSAAPTITQAGSSGTALSAATFYTLTVGGKTVVFKTPSDTKNSAYGNINTSGQVSQTSGWTLASGDALVIADSSNNWKLERTGITFDASTETECLTKKGTWKAFNNYSLPTAKNDTLGGVKPWYSHTAASTGPTTGSNATAIAVNAIQTTAGRYYAVESDSNGRLFVNVPWTNVNSSYLTSHNNLVTQNVKTDNKKYGIILSNYETSASTTTAAAVNRDSKVYVNPSLNSINAGQITIHNKAATPVEKAYMIWNDTDQSIDFVFN